MRCVIGVISEIAGIGDDLPMLVQLLPEQRFDEIAHAHVDVSVVFDIDFAIDRPYRFFLNDLRWTVTEIHVGAQTSQVQHEIRLVHPRDDWWRTNWTHMNPQVESMVHREGTLTEHG